MKDPRPKLLFLRLMALMLVVVALARPQSSHTTQERKVSGIDIVLVMDVSASMLAEDMAEQSRLDIAKQTMEKFIQGRGNDRIGFVIFSGEPLTLAPPTLDYSIVIRAIRDIETGVLKDGTGIGDGLALAVNRLRKSTAKSRIVVLLTDGDNNVGQIGPADAGELAKGFGIKVYTIAIGREGRIRIPIRSKTPLGNAVTSYIQQDNALNPELLQLIAQQTGGHFYRVQDLSTMQAVFDEIDQLEKTEVETKEKVRWKEGFSIYLKWALLILLIEQMLARFWWRPTV
jgi:Ca-activated chloride channel family protein